VITFLLALTGGTANAQKKEIKINKSLTETSAVSGQKLEGITDEMMMPIPVNKFEVMVTQNGATQQAKVRSATVFMIPAQVISKKQSSSDESTSKIVDSKEQLGEMKYYQSVLFTVPQKLEEGEASVVVKYRGRQSDEFNFNIVNRPPTPRILISLKTATILSGIPSQAPNVEKSRVPRLTFERGHETEIDIMPLIDPETPDSAVLVTFRQGIASYDTTAKVTRREGAEPSGDTVGFAPPRYEVTVKAPEELTAGPVQVEVKLRANGQTNDAGSISAVITDAASDNDHPADVAPLITGIDRPTVGIGQSFYLSINDAQKLDSDPSKTLVILEQDATRVELKPESNSAIYLKSQGLSAPAMLLVRVGKEITGKVTVKVYNLARGEQKGMSAGVSLEIVDDVLPPVINQIAESNKQEMALLKSLHDQAVKAGYDFKEYDPNARYVTIQATGLDPNPNFIRVQFEQGGQKFTLKFNDFSLTANGRNIVRLPASIKPGEVQVTIQNTGAGRTSKAVTYTFEVNQIGFTR
jgi:hypothetical protein